MPLRPYQSEQVDAARQTLSRKRSTLLQLATGGGKTHEFADITARTTANGHRTWIVVPRNELLKQASDHLLKYRVPHGLISAGTNESRAYKVHIVSKDTLIRRYDKIKNWPDLLIIDEAHLYLDRQIEIASHLPDTSKIIGFTATPERLDGRGLSTESGGLYDEISHGPTISDLIEMDYLSDMRYFCPPIEGLQQLHRRGTEYNPDELEALLQRRKIYGGAIQHYREHAHNKPALVFCRSVKAAAETAQRFNDAGYRFENIDGQMSYARRKSLIDALRNGDIQGLTSCELITYGLDVPRVECIIMLRPTLSRTLYFQMIGRGLRKYEIWQYPDGTTHENPSDKPEGARLVYAKPHCVILDHVGNMQEHGHPLEAYDWQFHGRDKRTGSAGVSASTLRLCGKCFMYYPEGNICPNCGDAHKVKKRADIEEVEGRLVEVKGPIELKKRPAEEQREIQDNIGRLIEACQLRPDGEGLFKIDNSAVSELLVLAESLGYDYMWVYHRVTTGMAVNIPLLHAIARAKDYKPGWVSFQVKKMQGRNTGLNKMMNR